MYVWFSDTKEALQFNSLDGKVDRRSHGEDYKIINGIPRYVCIKSLYVFLNIYNFNIISYSIMFL